LWKRYLQSWSLKSNESLNFDGGGVTGYCKRYESEGHDSTAQPVEKDDGEHSR